LKYREENVSGIKDDKQRIKENMKKLKEKLIQRINQIEKELTNKLDILTNWACSSLSVLWVMVWSIILLTVTSPNFLMDDNKSFDSSKESVTRFNSEVFVCCILPQRKLHEDN
jgi:hypothetical protein